MRKLISILAVTGSILVMAAMFAGCGKDKKSSENKADISSQAETSEESEIDVDVEEDEKEEKEEVPKLSSIVGTWTNDDGTGYTFNEDGTGTYNDGTDESEFTYTEKNFSIEITFSGKDESLKYDYVAAGTQLILKDKNESNEEFVYHKQ